MNAFELHAKLQAELGRPIQLRLIMQLEGLDKTADEIRALVTQAHKQFPHGKLDRLAPGSVQGGDRMKHVTIYTDGSCKGNPGPGGYGAILQYADSHGRKHERAISGGIAETTNNRAELTAAIQALSALKEPCVVDLYTDSQYLVTVATGGRAKANLDLVTELRALMSRHQVTVHHVEGHNGHPENERADRLAQACPEPVEGRRRPGRPVCRGTGRPGRRPEISSPSSPELCIKEIF